MSVQGTPKLAKQFSFWFPFESANNIIGFQLKKSWLVACWLACLVALQSRNGWLAGRPGGEDADPQQFGLQAHRSGRVPRAGAEANHRVPRLCEPPQPRRPKRAETDALRVMYIYIYIYVCEFMCVKIQPLLLLALHVATATCLYKALSLQYHCPASGKATVPR